MLTRRLAVRLLAPTALVGLAAVLACTAGVVYLNYLHLNVARDLSENVQSTQAAARLEATVEKLVSFLRSPPPAPDFYATVVAEQNAEALSLLDQAQALANFEREQILVAEIREGLQRYLRRWRERQGGGAAAKPRQDTDLAALLEREVLGPCRKLRTFNTDQIEQSDRDNRATVQKLRWGLLAVGFGLPLGGLVLGYVVARSLGHSIYQLSVRIRDAAGRLNRELGSVTVEEEGDLPDLHRRVQGITEEIERVVEQLQQREREVLRAEQLAAVGQVAAGVAHELRNPLTSVKMLVQTGLEGTSGEGLGREDLTVIEHEVRRMEQCIRQFLDFARPPAAAPRRGDLAVVVRRALALVEGRARRQRVRVEAALPGEPVTLTIDPEQIHQVLVNLLLNALDALPRGGTVRVTLDPDAGRVGHGLPPGEPAAGTLAVRWVELVVCDNGPGIAPRIRERLFEPFVSSKDTGLGLGLSISRRLVEAHGGTIRGENLREGGACFIVRLPAGDVPAREAPPASRPGVVPQEQLQS